MSAFAHLIFDGRNIDVARATGALHEFKVIQIKHALDPALLGRVRERALASRLSGWGAGQPLVVLETAGSRPSFDIVHAFRRSPGIRVLRAYFETDTILLTGQHSRFRHVRLEEDYEQLPFHQDGSALPEIPNVTCSALIHPDRAGEDVAGLQFIPGAADEILPRAQPESESTNFYDFLRIDPEVLEVAKKNGVWVPEFEFGDLLLFDRRCIHGTFVTEGMRDFRISADLRVWPFSRSVFHWPEYRWFVDHPRFLYGPTRIRREFADLPEDEFFAFVQAADYDYGLIESQPGGRLAYARTLLPHRWGHPGN